MLKRFATGLKRAVPLAAGIAMTGTMLSSPAMAHITNASGTGSRGASAIPSPVSITFWR